MTPDHINPAQWHQAIGVARQSCARIFRDGGTPAEALAAFGLIAERPGIDWSKAVDAIAVELCNAARPPVRLAA